MNFDIVGYPTTVHDVRNTPLEKEATLDQHDFQFLHHPALEKDFNSEQVILKKYYKEVQQLVVNEVPGAKKVVVFDHTLRRLAEEPKGDRGIDRGPLVLIF